MSSGSSRHRNDIQGLRAVAVLLVAFSHAGVGFLKGGYVGVDVFFVLSGYLITGLLLPEARRRRFGVSPPRLLVRRARRILPAAILTLLVTTRRRLRPAQLRPREGRPAGQHSGRAVRRQHPLRPAATDYFAQGQHPSPVQHFWSLSVEEQFYIVWPALFGVVLGLAVRRTRRARRLLPYGRVSRVLLGRWLIAVVLLAWSIHDTSVRSPTAAYFSTFDRAWEFALGAALAVGASRLTTAPPGGGRQGMSWYRLASRPRR